MEVVPAETPVTTPDAFTEAMAAFDVLQVPPEVPSVSVDDVPWQKVVVPVMLPAVGVAVMVTEAVVVAVPQPLVTE